VEQKNIAFNVSVHNRFSALADSEGISNSNKLWDNLKTSLNGATCQVCPVLRRNNRPWISDTTLRLVEQRHTTHSRPLRSGLAHRIKRSLKDDEQAWLTNRADDMQQAADRGDYRTVYANIRLLTGRGRSAPPTTILDQNGLVIKSDELQTQRWAEYFSSLYNRPNPTTTDTSLQGIMPAASSLVDESPPSLIEVKAAVHSLKQRKSPGTCDIPAEVIKALNDENLILIRDLLSMIWTERSVPQDFKDGIIVPVYKKGSKQDCANYRGITLLSITGKILTIILRKRLECLYESTIKEEQAGFRTGRGCVDHIFTLRRCLERRLWHGQPTVACFIDFAAAFDSVHRASMWNVLRKCGVPTLITDIITSMYSGANSCVRTKNGCSAPFPISTGVRQGCVLSPLLFNLVLNWILTKSFSPADGVTCSQVDQIQELSYADDIVILQPDSASCQDLLDRISEKAEMLGLKIKPAKTKVIYFHLDQQPNLTVYGEPIEVTEFFTYLGSGISSRHTSAKDEISARVGKASTTFNQLKHRIFKRQDLSLGLKMKVFNASVLSVLFYSSETWTMTKADLMTLETFQMYALRAILGVSRLQRLRNMDIREVCCHQPTIDNSIRLQRLRWLGDVARMPAGRLCGSIWRNPKPSGWRCTHNASKCTWDSTIQKDLGFLKSSYGSVNWHNNSTSIIQDLASDRVQWRRIVRGQATAGIT